MSETSKVTIKEEFRDRTFATMCIEGLSVEEVNEILSRRDEDDALGEVMEKHGFGNTFECWKCGYGIYGIRHVGGHLFVKIGNTCD